MKTYYLLNVANNSIIESKFDDFDTAIDYVVDLQEEVIEKSGKLEIQVVEFDGKTNVVVAEFEIDRSNSAY